MDEMNATVGEVAENAAKASETSDTARAKAQEGAQMVCNVVNDITAVQKQSLEVKLDMNQASVLSPSSVSARR